jgi:mRNA-degrading endonuclease HigB of HigAB toxin-antitoxin module
VWETDFTGLADNLGILFRLHYRSRNQLFKLSKDDIRLQIKGENGLHGRRRKALTRDIFTDCESAWDNDNFVLEINLNVLEVARWQDPSHVARTLAQRNNVVVDSAVICVVKVEIFHLKVLRR